MPLILAMFGFFIQGIYGAIYRLNESEYARMPAVFYLEPYEPCVGRGGVYCTVRFQLTSDTGSDLADMIREYSAHTETHYNHTNLEYGICLTKCKQNFNTNKTLDQDEVLEGCLNETLSREYRLKANISEPAFCHKSDETIPLDAGDMIVAGVILLLLVINVVGSFYDFYVKENNEGSILKCFSVQRNWSSLVAPLGEGPEPRITRLKGFYGIRTITVMLVISGHSVMSFAFSTINTHFIEESFHNPIYQLMMNSLPIVQTFFIISGFLLIFNLQLTAERRPLSWTILPRGVLMRWLRFTPPYAVVLAITATWLRFFGPGPLWQTISGDAIAACRSKWWENLLYFNNYVDGPQCMPHSWYIAADLQLHTVGLMVGLMTKGGVRKLVLLLLFVVGLVGPAVHTYFQDLDGVLMMRPESIRVIFYKDPTINHVYKRGHTNLACFVIGLSLGLIAYHWQKEDFKLEKYLRYRYLYWSLFPAMLLVLYSSSVFYLPAPRAPLYLRVIFAALLKPLFGSLIAVLVIGMVFKYENAYRGVLEWGGWGVPSRLSYCAYVVHMLLVRVLAGTRTSLVYTSFIHAFENIFGTVVISYLAAVPLALLVEIPFHKVVKMATTSKKKLSTMNLGQR